MNIFGFRPFKGRFNLGNSDDIPTNNDGTLIGAIKQINTHLTASNNTPFRFGYQGGKYGYIVESGGADTFYPFKSGSTIRYHYQFTQVIPYNDYSYHTYTESVNCTSINDYQHLTANNFVCLYDSFSVNSATQASYADFSAQKPTWTYNASTGILTVSFQVLLGRAFPANNAWVRLDVYYCN